MVSYPRNLAGVMVVGMCAFMAAEAWSWNRTIAVAVAAMGLFRLVVLVRDLTRRRPRPD